MKALGVIVVVAMMAVGLSDPAGAGKEGRHEGKGYRGSTPAQPVVQDDPSQARQPVEPTTPSPGAPTTLSPGALYQDQCGACHLAYPAEFLPSGSWRAILAALNDHFGESLTISPETAQEIMNYLEANAADRSTSKRAAKVMGSLGGTTPLRVTEVPYILKKHHKISSDVLRRPSIGSLANCAACHRTAANGVYDDHSVVIPK